ncbi:MAG: ATP-binding protein, partial [Thiohalocapsa sp.]
APEDALPRLFERLYRVEDSRSRATGGAGLGLAIASNIVEAHGGAIAAEASPLGGLRIRIRLPAKTHSDSST